MKSALSFIIMMMILLLSCKKNNTSNTSSRGSGTDSSTNTTDTVGHSIEFVGTSTLPVTPFTIRADGTGFSSFTVPDNITGLTVNPISSITKAPDGRYYTTSTLGGDNGAGTLFNIDYTAKRATKISNNSSIASSITGWTLADDGKLYRLILEANTGESQIQFIDPTDNTYGHTWHSVIPEVGLNSNRMIKANDGNLYGVTNAGLPEDGKQYGCLYKYDPRMKIATRLQYVNPAYGHNILGPLCLATDGFFYGISNNGGAKNMGAVFKFNATGQVYSKVIDFDSTNGNFPSNSNLVQAPNGKLYGITAGGGMNNRGVIFSYNITTGVQKVEYHFKNDLTGSGPSHFLMIAKNDMIYGLTAGTGLFRFNPANNQYKNICLLPYTSMIVEK